MTIVAVALVVSWASFLVATKKLQLSFVRGASRGWKLYALSITCLPIAVVIGVVTTLALRETLSPVEAVVVSLGGALVADLWYTSVVVRWRSQARAWSKFRERLNEGEPTVGRLSRIPVLGALLGAVRKRTQE